jgi:hypothetical protein
MVDTKEAETSADQVLNVDQRIQELSQNCGPFYKNRNLLRLYLLLIPGCLVPAITLGFDAAMMNGLQAVPSWDSCKFFQRGPLVFLFESLSKSFQTLESPVVPNWGSYPLFFPLVVSWQRLLSASLATAGVVVWASSLVVPSWPLVVSSRVFLLTVGHLPVAPLPGFGQRSRANLTLQVAMFLISRFIIGFGLVFANSYSPMLIGELAHPKDRQVVTSLYQTSWYIGAILAAWITFATFNMGSEWAWRIPSLLQAAPAFVPICTVFLLPESPRWLIANGRADQARAVLIKWHANGNEDDELVNLQYQQMEAIIREEVENQAGWKSLFKSPGNRRRVFILVCLGCFSQWSGNGLVS